MPTGSEALRLLEEGKVMKSDMADGLKLRLNQMTHNMECLHEGRLPVDQDYSCQWVTVSLSLSLLYKYDWTVVEDCE